MVDFTGKYTLTSSDNFEAVLEYRGAPKEFIANVKNQSQELEISKTGDEYSMKSITGTNQVQESKYVLGHEHRETMPDGGTQASLVVSDGPNRHIHTVGVGEKQLTAVYELNDNELRVTITAGPVVAVHQDGTLEVGIGRSYDWLLAIKDFTVRPTDIWLCGYHKSGNTWLSEMVSLIMADGVVDRVRERPIEERVPNVFLNYEFNNQLQWFESIPVPRIINSHLQYKLMPSFKSTNCKVFNGDWCQHVNDYWLSYGSGKQPNVLFVAYEELVANAATMVRTIAHFLGKQFADKTVDTIVSHCSLDTMRDNPMANRAELLTTCGTPGARFVRKGVVGDWRSNMTDVESARFDRRYAQRLAAIGLRVCDDMADAQR
ncbi:unnamed protein product [Medioppia subpectinata]|uniref:Cytosolic fatty-acid binding proteins domain-containing protein n=1 Tax=Medioppia subpectinata TaxID=1979941 RepID=A0A7R9KDH0_9ACAR|nr:unnamed protein product [Medioppia subpectinata]CAG2101260.1 unnamed protein product [Medioppia subpectinata]